MWLIVRSGPDEGAAVEVTGERFVLGRQRGCELVVRDERASRRHVELVATGDGRLRLHDLDSANGTYVEGRRVQEAVLEGGEEVRIGNVIISVADRPPSRATAVPRPAPTYSMVGRLIEQGTRRARRTAFAAGAVALAAVAALGVLLATGTIGGGEGRVPEVVARLSPSTVLVETLRAGTRTGTGSGWVLDAGDGLVVTNAHVINQGEEYRVGGGAASVAGVAPCEDLALLRVGDRDDGLRTAPLGSGASLQQGETVVALGYGADAEPGDTVGSTTGVVSVPSTAFRDPAPDVPAYPEVVQTDTALNPGNSGGPLADVDGRVIGVNSAARTSGSGGRALQNVNYAIAIDRARRVLDELRAGRSRGWTGLSFGYPTDEELQRERLPPGLRITGVVRGAPEDLVGRLLAGVDGRPVRNTLQSYCDAAGDLRTGDTVTLALASPGETATETVRLRLP